VRPAKPSLASVPGKRDWRPPHQPSLFQVIPFESIAPVRKNAAKGPQAEPKPAVRRRAPKPRGPLFAEAARQAEARTKPEPYVACNAPVAPLWDRGRAVAVDLAVAAAGLCLFLAVFGFWSRALPYGARVWATFGLVSALLFLLYKLLGCMLGVPTVGERVVGLRVLHFDGRPASKRQRLVRLASGCLSAMPAGVGLLYALINEEHLGFHDLISETFVTPARLVR